jgi:hypothetical protein
VSQFDKITADQARRLLEVLDDLGDTYVGYLAAWAQDQRMYPEGTEALVLLSEKTAARRRRVTAR